MKLVLTTAAALSLVGAGMAFAQGSTRAPPAATTQTGTAGTVAAELHDANPGPGVTNLIANTPDGGPPTAYPVCGAVGQDRCIAQPRSYARSGAQALNSTGVPPTNTAASGDQPR